MAQCAVRQADLDLILLVGTEVAGGYLVRERDCRIAKSRPSGGPPARLRDACSVRILWWILIVESEHSARGRGMRSRLGLPETEYVEKHHAMFGEPIGRRVSELAGNNRPIECSNLIEPHHGRNFQAGSWSSAKQCHMGIGSQDGGVKADNKV